MSSNAARLLVLQRLVALDREEEEAAAMAELTDSSGSSSAGSDDDYIGSDVSSDDGESDQRAPLPTRESRGRAPAPTVLSKYLAESAERAAAAEAKARQSRVDAVVRAALREAAAEEID